jgi:hypothetical protein
MSVTEVRGRRFPIIGVLLLGAAAIFAYLGVLGIVELDREHDDFVSASECQFDPHDSGPLPDDFDPEDCQESEDREWRGSSKASPAWFFAALPTWFVGMVATFGIGPSCGRRRGLGHGSSGHHSGSSWGSDSSCGNSGGSSSSCGSSSGSSD